MSLRFSAQEITTVNFLLPVRRVRKGGTHKKKIEHSSKINRVLFKCQKNLHRFDGNMLASSPFSGNLRALRTQSLMMSESIRLCPRSL